MKIEEGALARDKRRAPRMPADWDVRARVLGQDEQFGPVRMDNVSKHGLSVRLTRAVEREAILKLSFTPTDGGGEVHAYATVAWFTGEEELHAGLRFMGIGEKEEERIAQLVERWMLSGSLTRN